MCLAVVLDPLTPRCRLRDLDVLAHPTQRAVERTAVPGSDGVVRHTEAQQLPRISDGEITIQYCGDVIPTRVHVPIPWVMGYDIRPLQTMEEKKSLLRRAVDEDWILAYEHDPVLAATRVVETEKGFAAGEAVTGGGEVEMDRAQCEQLKNLGYVEDCSHL